jgi:HEPN domain-containing protein
MLAGSMNRKHDWLRESEAELRAAETLFGAGHYSWTCFTAHQSAEKSFKAVLLHLGKRTATHDIVDLLKALSPNLAIPADVVKAGNTLNRYYVATRYPDSFATGAPSDKYFEPDAKEAVELARLIHDFAAATLGAPGASSP